MAFCYVHIRKKEDRTGEQNKNNYKTQGKKKNYQRKERGEGKNSKKSTRIASWCRKAPENLSADSLQQKKMEDNLISVIN